MIVYIITIVILGVIELGCRTQNLNVGSLILTTNSKIYRMHANLYWFALL